MGDKTMKLERMKLGTKIMGGFALITAILLIVGVMGYVEVKSVSKSFHAVSDVRLPSIKYLAQIETNLERLQKGYYKLLSQNLTLSEREKTLAEIANYRINYIKANEAFAPLEQSAEESIVYAELLRSVTEWREFNVNQVDKLNNQLMTLIGVNGAEDELNSIYSRMADYIVNRSGVYHQRVMSQIEKLMEINMKLAQEETLKGDEIVRTSTLMVFFTIAIGLVLAIFIGVFITRSVKNDVGGEPADVMHVAIYHTISKTFNEPREFLGQYRK
jgi:methyl-accepting chemotaxis protein